MDQRRKTSTSSKKLKSRGASRRAVAANFEDGMDREQLKTAVGAVNHQDQHRTVMGPELRKWGRPYGHTERNQKKTPETGTERWSHSAGCNRETIWGSVNPDQYSNVFGPVVRKRKPPIHSNLETMLTGKTRMNEWWSSISAYLGARQSRLHMEILTFCKANELTEEQSQVRAAAQNYLEGVVLEIWPSAQVHLFGSTAMGLALPTSDIDVVVVMPPAQKGLGAGLFPDTGPWVTELYTILQSRDDMFQSLTQIPHAKVPVLKTIFKSGIACDISFDWPERKPGQGVQIVKQFLQQNSALRPLCIVLKSFLRHQNLNEVFSGGISSFCLTIMVVSHLQNLGGEGAVTDLGALLLSFFTRYSCMHNYSTDVVSTTPGKRLSKAARGWGNPSAPACLAVENPLDPSSDIGAASYKIPEVRIKFTQGKRVLLRHWDEERSLDLIFRECIT